MKTALKICAATIAMAALMQTAYKASTADASGPEEAVVANTAEAQEANAMLVNVLLNQEAQFQAVDTSQITMSAADREKMVDSIMDVIEKNGLTDEMIEKIRGILGKEDPSI